MKIIYSLNSELWNYLMYTITNDNIFVIFKKEAAQWFNSVGMKVPIVQIIRIIVPGHGFIVNIDIPEELQILFILRFQPKLVPLDIQERC